MGFYKKPSEGPSSKSFLIMPSKLKVFSSKSFLRLLEIIQNDALATNWGSKQKPFTQSRDDAGIITLIIT